MTKLSPARRIAVEVGAAVRERGAYASDVFDARMATEARFMEPQDRAFARLLVLGVAATWGTLDEVIDRCLRSRRDINDDVRDALRISTYEIVFLRKADHAAVDQGVELVRCVTQKAAGLANAVLRKIVIAAQEFPFGDPATDDAALARLHGFPLWLAQLLVEQMGRERAAMFMAVSNLQAPLYIAVNRCRTTDENVRDAFLKAGVEIDSVRLSSDAQPIAGCYRLPDTTAIASKAARELLDDGAILVSDAAAQCVARLAVPKVMPTGLLEVGSGRGTKTILLQSEAVRRFDAQMPMVSLDSHGFKMDVLRKRLGVYGVNVDTFVRADARKPADALADAAIDCVFVDAPCSGLGTLRRHPEIRWRLQKSDIAAMAQVSLDILKAMSAYVTVGKPLLYATCSVAAEENEQVVKRFLESEEGTDFKIVPLPLTSASKLFFKTQLSPQGCDAHFAALMTRVR